jgi:phosphatidate cytidylyltransferase
MAFNLQTFKTRALTAVVFVLVMLAGLLWNHWSFFILFSIIHFGCWIEYHQLVGKINPAYAQISNMHRVGSMMTGWAFMLWMSSDVFHIAGISLHSIGFWLILIFALVLPIIEVLFSSNLNLRMVAYSFLGLLYISVSWALMIDMRQMELVQNAQLVADSGWMIAIVLIASIWINDTMAYIVGSLIGKTPLSPISPKKTWEGTVGGAVLCIVTVTLIGARLLPLDYWVLLGVSAIAAIAATSGDLVESKLKRMANVKDSGKLMPGHGGFLDRFDSLLFATPFVWLFLVLYNMIME